MATTHRFDLPTDEQGKATELRVFSWGRTKDNNPHMRAFWFATFSFFWAFFGWFAFPPLMSVVREDLGLCDGYDDDGKCQCGSGTRCKHILALSSQAAVTSTIVARVALGYLLETFGPRRVQASLLVLGALFLALSTAISNGTELIVVSFFIGIIGATFVTNQFWSSIMFNEKVVGTANATTGGWGNLGGGVTQLVMPLLYSLFLDGFGMSRGASWRLAMLVPATIFLIVAVSLLALSVDTPHGQFDVAFLGKRKASCMDYIHVLKDPRVWVLIMQYGASFGTELVMDSRLATHFADMDWRDGVTLDVTTAGFAASAFGLMNIFARSLGGMASDAAFRHRGLRGRVWVQLFALLLEGAALLLFSFMDRFWYSLASLVLFGLGAQMACGTTYGIVPVISPQQLGAISALVGAGGNLGAVLGTQIYASYSGSDLLVPFRWHAGFVLMLAVPTLVLFPKTARVNPSTLLV